MGVTANSFTSLSLDPPLVLWCISTKAPSLPAFQAATHFAINVLCSNQHYLSRQFATPAEDKFAGVEFSDGPGGVPVLAGVLGEVERFEAREDEPLVFHSGAYRIATRHPDIDRTP